MKQKITLSLVIPVYNEAVVLLPFWEKLAPILDTLTVSYEIIFIDDGSQDGTWTNIQQLAGHYVDIRGIRFTRNFGKEAAILAGLEQAQGQAVVVMDGDGQHPPELLPEMVARWQKGVTMIVARKRTRKYDSFFKRIAARGFNLLMNRMTGLDLNHSTDYRLLDRQVVQTLLACPERVRFFRGMSVWTGFAYETIAFDVPPRLAGVSHWGQTALFGLALQAIAAYSAKPLFYLFNAGLLGLFLAFLLGLQALYSWLTGIAVSGWTSLTVLILFFGSAHLVGLGVLGIYLAQIFDEVKQRPRYLIGELTRNQD